MPFSVLRQNCKVDDNMTRLRLPRWARVDRRSLFFLVFAYALIAPHSLGNGEGLVPGADAAAAAAGNWLGNILGRNKDEGDGKADGPPGDDPRRRQQQQQLPPPAFPQGGGTAAGRPSTQKRPLRPPPASFGGRRFPLPPPPPLPGAHRSQQGPPSEPQGQPRAEFRPPPPPPPPGDKEVPVEDEGEGVIEDDAGPETGFWGEELSATAAPEEGNDEEDGPVTPAAVDSDVEGKHFAADGDAVAVADGDNKGGENENEGPGEGPNESYQYPPPPPPPGAQDGSWDQEGQQTSARAWGSYEQEEPPPPGYDEWQEQQRRHQQEQAMMMAQQHQQWYDGGWRPGGVGAGGDDHHAALVAASLRSELDASMEREMDLTYRIQNLTASLDALERTAGVQQSQIDALTERSIDAETAASAERNAALELEANCTALGRIVDELRDEVSSWEEKCVGLQGERECDEEKMAELRSALKRKTSEMEDMACLVETERVDAERQKYLAELRRKKQKRGFFSWLFGWGDDEDEEDEEMRLKELSRSTLLHALETERNNVYELEAALSTLQQNNSAISDMVKSRDSLVNELNDRVAVFEEDKIVLKAALRQLQKEMKEEAPKTQKLVSDLRDARDAADALRGEIENLHVAHADEMQSLRLQMEERERNMNETQSKLNLIGTYVDQLEERLASFAIARRDISVREERCSEIEMHEVQREKAQIELKRKVNELTEEKTELKNLMELLVEERTTLRREKAELAQLKDSLVFDGRELREKVGELDAEIQRLVNEADEANKKLKNVDENCRILSEEKSVLQATLDEQQHELNETYAILRSKDKALEDQQNALDEATAALEAKNDAQAETTKGADGVEGDDDDHCPGAPLDEYEVLEESDAFESAADEEIHRVASAPEAEQNPCVADNDNAFSEKQVVRIDGTEENDEIGTTAQHGMSFGTTDIHPGIIDRSGDSTMTAADWGDSEDSEDGNSDGVDSLSHGVVGPDGEPLPGRQSNEPPDLPTAGEVPLVLPLPQGLESRENLTREATLPSPVVAEKDSEAMPSTPEEPKKEAPLLPRSETKPLAPPPLPGIGESNGSLEYSRKNDGRLRPSPPQPRSVPFRQLRKDFSQVTGLHGVFTPSSRQQEKSHSPLPADASQPRSVPFRQLRKAFSKATGLHGVLTPSSNQKEKRNLPPRRVPPPKGPPPKDLLQVSAQHPNIASQDIKQR